MQKMNSRNGAIAAQPKSGHKPPAGPKGNASAVGAQKGAKVKEAQNSGPMSGASSLMGAVKHLASEHPEKYDDHGPHHGKR